MRRLWMSFALVWVYRRPDHSACIELALVYNIILRYVGSRWQLDEKFDDGQKFIRQHITIRCVVSQSYSYGVKVRGCLWIIWRYPVILLHLTSPCVRVFFSQSTLAARMPTSVTNVPCFREEPSNTGHTWVLLARGTCSFVKAGNSRIQGYPESNHNGGLKILTLKINPVHVDLWVPKLGSRCNGVEELGRLGS